MVVSMEIKGAATKLVEDTNLPDFAENIEISYRFYRTYVNFFPKKEKYKQLFVPFWPGLKILDKIPPPALQSTFPCSTFFFFSPPIL
jgi:hypothetical protein